MLVAQVANLYGKGADKLSFDGRVEFARNHMNDIFDAADNPAGGSRYGSSPGIYLTVVDHNVIVVVTFHCYDYLPGQDVCHHVCGSCGLVTSDEVMKKSTQCMWCIAMPLAGQCMVPYLRQHAPATPLLSALGSLDLMAQGLRGCRTPLTAAGSVP